MWVAWVYVRLCVCYDLSANDGGVGMRVARLKWNVWTIVSLSLFPISDVKFTSNMGNDLPDPAHPPPPPARLRRRIWDRVGRPKCCVGQIPHAHTRKGVLVDGCN